jgi:hypothetical protein
MCAGALSPLPEMANLLNWEHARVKVVIRILKVPDRLLSCEQQEKPPFAFPKCVLWFAYRAKAKVASDYLILVTRRFVV